MKKTFLLLMAMLLTLTLFSCGKKADKAENEDITGETSKPTSTTSHTPNNDDSKASEKEKNETPEKEDSRYSDIDHIVKEYTPINADTLHYDSATVTPLGYELWEEYGSGNATHICLHVKIENLTDGEFSTKNNLTYALYQDGVPVPFQISYLSGSIWESRAGEVIIPAASSDEVYLFATLRNTFFDVNAKFYIYYDGNMSVEQSVTFSLE